MRCALGMLAAIEELDPGPAEPSTWPWAVGITVARPWSAQGAVQGPRASSGTWSTPARGSRGWPQAGGVVVGEATLRRPAALRLRGAEDGRVEGKADPVRM